MVANFKPSLHSASAYANKIPTNHDFVNLKFVKAQRLYGKPIRCTCMYMVKLRTG